jgi:hypothetical protein
MDTRRRLVKTITLSRLTPAQEESWRVLLDLCDAMPSGWCLIGGQMTWLLALEHGVTPLRATEDVDVAADIRADQHAITRICAWLESRGFELAGISTDGIGHRFISTTYRGPGRVTFDVLAPDNVGPRADLTSSPPARTISAPGTRAALDSARPVQVALADGRTGNVLLPDLLAAILAKTAATGIPGRDDPARDWADLAFLLTLVTDPIGVAETISGGQRRKLHAIGTLLSRNHPAWSEVGERAQAGIEALGFLLGD